MYRMKNKSSKEFTATPSKYPQKKFNDKECKNCNTVFSPIAPSHHYCSDECAQEGLTSRYLKRTYGIVYQDYKNMLEEQKGVCKICKGEGFTMAKHHKLKLVVDHCHSTGKVRGLLCHNCNRALGLLQDDEKICKEAANYLLTFK